MLTFKNVYFCNNDVMIIEVKTDDQQSCTKNWFVMKKNPESDSKSTALVKQFCKCL